jgi:hypothetical protein
MGAQLKSVLPKPKRDEGDPIDKRIVCGSSDKFADLDVKGFWTTHAGSAIVGIVQVMRFKHGTRMRMLIL